MFSAARNYAKLENGCRIVQPHIEYVGCEVPFPMGDAKRNTWLQINRRFVGTRVLHRQASMKPVGRRVNKFIPAIEKIASAVPYVVDVFALYRQVEALPRKRNFVTGCHPSRIPKDNPEHRSHFKGQFFVKAQVVSGPKRRSLLFFIVLARFQM